MTDKIALGLAGLIIAFLCVDAIGFDWSATVFLFKEILRLMGWIAFWR